MSAITTPADLVLPNFLIVGAMKAGTSSLADMISEHPDIYVAPEELHFFNHEQEFSKGLAHYSRHFRHSSKAWKGEKTPVYSRIADMPYLPERIHQSLGSQLRLFWIFRDPVERAVSHYRHMLVTQGNPDRQSIIKRDGGLRTFAEVIERELAGVTSPVIVSRGYYSQQVIAFQQYFPKDNFVFFKFDELSSNPQLVMDKACDFLRVSKINVAKTPSKNSSRQRMGQGLTSKIIRRVRTASLPSAQSIRDNLNGIIQKKEVEARFHAIDAAAKQRLAEHYLPHQQALMPLINPGN